MEGSLADGTCSLFCPGLSCPKDYCENNGSCSVNKAACSLQCSCGVSYKGDSCQLGKEIVQAKLVNPELNAIYRMNLTFVGEQYSSALKDSTSVEYATRKFNYTNKVEQRLSGVSLFSKVNLNRFIDRGNTTMFTEMTANYNYTPTKDVIMIYNGTLVHNINISFDKQIRGLNTIYLDTLVQDYVVPRDTLVNFYSCDTVFRGYTVVLDSVQGVICMSPCSDANYCKNGGTCQHLAAGAQCSCPANFNGQFCENDVSGVSRGVFFGVLFGVLGGLLLLLLGLLAFCLCRKNNESFFDDKHNIIRSSSRGSYVPWLSSMSESTLQGSVPGITLKGVKTRLENLDIRSKISTKRPTIVNPKAMDEVSMSSE